MVSVELVVKHKVGLHARPATLFTQEAQKYISSVFLDYEGRQANAKSILEVMGLGIGCGATISLMAEGDDELAAVGGLKNLIESDFGEAE